MRYINRERAALALILLACMLAECIPLMLALVALSALVLFLPNCQAIVNFRRRLSGCITRFVRTAARTLTRGEICDCSEKEKGRPVREAPDGQGKKTRDCPCVYSKRKKGGCQA